MRKKASFLWLMAMLLLLLPGQGLAWVPPAELLFIWYCEALIPVSGLTAEAEICGKPVRDATSPEGVAGKEAPREEAAPEGAEAKEGEGAAAKREKKRAASKPEASCPQPTLAQVFLRFPGDYREQAGPAYTILATPQGIIKAGDGIILARQPDVLDRYRDPLVYRHPEELTEVLSAAGVDLSVSSLGRFQGRVCYVIGAAYPDLTRPQIWFDKETKLLIRFVMAPAEAGAEHAAWECLYGDWKSLTVKEGGTALFPSRMILLKNGETFWRRTLGKLTPNPVFAPELFDLSALDEQIGREGRDGRPEAGDRSEIKEMLEGFERMLP